MHTIERPISEPVGILAAIRRGILFAVPDLLYQLDC